MSGAPSHVYDQCGCRQGLTTFDLRTGGPDARRITFLNDIGHHSVRLANLHVVGISSGGPAGRS